MKKLNVFMSATLLLNIVNKPIKIIMQPRNTGIVKYVERKKRKYGKNKILGYK